MKKGVLMLVLAVLTTLSAKAQEEIITEPARKDTIRLLTIGNSFSQDAVEQYLYELADEVGIHMIIGNAYKGGQSLEQHWNDLTQEHDVYEYRKVVNGIRTNTPHALLPPIITDEPWDFISFQQASHYSGLTTTYEPFLSQLVQFTDSIKTGQDVRYGWHMTWAYSKDSNHGGFANYSRSQEVMYDSIRYAVQWARILHPEFSFNVPCGTAIQNARTSYLGDNLCRDGYHLDLKFGRYTAACAWLETLTGISPVGLSYRPEGVDYTAAHACQVAAHAAVQNPYVVTNLRSEGFPAQNDIVPTGLVKINFAERAYEGSDWNTITPAMRTYTWITDASCTLTLGHMNPELEYDFTFFASRQDCQDLRETMFTLQGEKIYTDDVEAANNTSHSAYIKNVRPTTDGKIVINVAPGKKNYSKNRFYYLNAMTIKAHK